MIGKLIVFVIALTLCVSCYSFAPVSRFVRAGALKAANADFSALEAKLAQKRAEQTTTTATAVKKETKPVSAKTSAAAPATKTATVAPSKPAVVSKPVVQKPVAVSQSASPAVVAKKEAPVVIRKTETKTVAVQGTPAPAPTPAGSNDALVGVSLGLAPFLLLPVVALNAAKQIKIKPKPLPVEQPKATKIAVYNKPLGVGAKEGIDELLSGKKTEDLENTRRGIKFSIGGFAAAAAATAVLFTLNPSKPPESAVAPAKPAAVVTAKKVVDVKPAAPTAVKTQAPKAAAPAAVPAPVVDTKKVEDDKVAAEKKAADEKVTAEKKAAEEKAAAEKKAAEEKAAADKKAADDKAAAEKKAADEKAVAEKKAAEAVAAAPKKVEVPKPVEVAPDAYQPKIPKGMEPDTVDIDAVKALLVCAYQSITHC